MKSLVVGVAVLAALIATALRSSLACAAVHIRGQQRRGTLLV
ncbi:MAG: hypothetical protein ACHQ9S_26555 [Candidatus Binatia bacterium]